MGGSGKIKNPGMTYGGMCPSDDNMGNFQNSGCGAVNLTFSHGTVGGTMYKNFFNLTFETMRSTDMFAAILIFNQPFASPSSTSWRTIEVNYFK